MLRFLPCSFISFILKLKWPSEYQDNLTLRLPDADEWWWQSWFCIAYLMSGKSVVIKMKFMTCTFTFSIYSYRYTVQMARGSFLYTFTEICINHDLWMWYWYQHCLPRLLSCLGWGGRFGPSHVDRPVTRARSTAHSAQNVSLHNFISDGYFTMSMLYTIEWKTYPESTIIIKKQESRFVFSCEEAALEVQLV